MMRATALLLCACTLLAQPANPERLFQEAVAAQERGDDATALAKYQQLLRLHPGAVAVRVNLGATLAHMGRLDEAIAQYRAALATEPGNRQVRLNLALAYQRKGDLAAAVALLESLHKSQPADARAGLLLGDCYSQLGRFADAVAVLLPLERGMAGDPDLAWLLGAALIRAGRAPEGLPRVEQAAAEGQNADAYLLAAETRLNRNEFDLARRHTDAALRLNPALPGGQTILGMVLEQTGDYEGAEAALRRALAADAKDFNAHYYMGALLYFRRDLEAARLQLEQALALQPASAQAQYQLALVARQQGHLEEALGGLEAAARQSPEWLPPHVELSALYFRLERAEDGARERQTVDRLMAAQQARGASGGPAVGRIP